MNSLYEVRDSLIPNAGKGLFALKRIRRQARIGYYTGVRRCPKAPRLDTTYYMYRPAYYDKKRRKRVGAHIVDGSPLSNDMRWINHSDKPNTIYRALSTGELAVYALRDIAPGEELLAYYGYSVQSPSSSRESLQ